MIAPLTSTTRERYTDYLRVVALHDGTLADMLRHLLEDSAANVALRAENARLEERLRWAEASIDALKEHIDRLEAPAFEGVDEPHEFRQDRDDDERWKDFPRIIRA